MLITIAWSSRRSRRAPVALAALARSSAVCFRRTLRGTAWSIVEIVIPWSLPTTVAGKPRQRQITPWGVITSDGVWLSGARETSTAIGRRYAVRGTYAVPPRSTVGLDSSRGQAEQTSESSGDESRGFLRRTRSF